MTLHPEPRPTGPRRPRFEFVPAAWLVLALTIARRVLVGGPVTKVGIAGLVWSVAPRKLKLVAVGMAVWAAVLALGALAAIVLLALQVG
jgi:hypothetical protein